MLEQLLKVLTLEQVGEDDFIGINMHPQGFRVYGGQVLAQAVSAAQQTVADDRAFHSQHAYFLREGDSSKPIHYQVERARDGGSFSSRRVVALQDDKVVLVASISFQKPCDDFDFQIDLPDVAPPETLQSERERAIAAGTLDETMMITDGLDLDVRMLTPINWHKPVQHSGSLNGWMKTIGKLPDDPNIHRSVLTYMSDCMLLDAGMVEHGLTFVTGKIQVASLDHALWLHEDFRADEWLLQSAELERNSGGRTLIRGRFHTREGRHVATTMQQGLMRSR